MGEQRKTKKKVFQTETETQTPSASILIPDSWSQAADSIAYDSITSPPPIAFICGAKNSGKTTFSRHLLNTLLPRYRKVAYLDTDVGQPEFSPPGCLSLNFIDKLTPDLTIPCLKTPERCLFFGDISSKRDPKGYLKNIFSLYDYFRKEYYLSNESENPGKTQLPLVVNTPGWIRISAESKNLPTGAFWLDVNHDGVVNLIDISPARQDSFNRSVLIQKDARLMRDLRIIAYFRQCFPSDLNITTFKHLAHAIASHPPYEVPISRIKVTHLHCQVPSSEIFHSLNATIVGLAVSSANSTKSEPCTPWCVGLGIVRGFDILKGIFYVITPVPQCNLEKVDLFLQGFIQIPTSLLQVQGCISPYMSANVLSTN